MDVIDVSDDDDAVPANKKKRTHSPPSNSSAQTIGVVDLTFDDAEDNEATIVNTFQQSLENVDDNDDLIEVTVPNIQLLKKYRDAITTLKSIRDTCVATPKATSTVKSKKQSITYRGFTAGTGYGGGGSSETISKNSKVLQAKSKLNQQDQKIAHAFSQINYCLISNTTLDDSLLFEVSQGRIPVLWAFHEYLHNNSLMDIVERVELYQALFNLLKTISSNTSLIDRFMESSALCSIISSVALSSTMSTTNTSYISSNSSDEILTLCKCLELLQEINEQGISFLKIQKSAKIMSVDEEFMKSLQIAQDVRTAFEQLRGALHLYRITHQGSSTLSPPSVSALSDLDLTDSTSSVVANSDLKPSATYNLNENLIVNTNSLEDSIDSKEVAARLRITRFLTSLFKSDPNASSSSSATVESEIDKINNQYIQALKPYRLEMTRLLSTETSPPVHFPYSFRNQLFCEMQANRARATRVMNEISSLTTSLPIEFGSSIFVKVDEDRYDVIKALITGPVGTPYENGCFEFDIFLPARYPDIPPKVQFLTTGQGTVRFNPNLYHCGKVCLSLLGTWKGPSWDPKSSTLLQVLVSIQALIFVADPYFNEPGYEGTMNTPNGESNNEFYNSNIRAHTLNHAILTPLRQAISTSNISSSSSSSSTKKRATASASYVFNEIIFTHFRLKQMNVINQIHEWNLQKTGPGRATLALLNQLS